MKESEQQQTVSNPISSLRLEVLTLSRISANQYEITGRCINQSTVNRDDNQIKVVLEGVWTQNKIVKQSIIHLINPQFDSTTKTYTVSNSSGFLVLEPDNLLTCTLVASSLFCERKTWLNSVFLGQVGTNRAMLVGTLVHEVFQHGLKNRIADIDKLTKFLDEQLDDATVMLETYSVELHLNDIRNEAISYISSVKEWIDKYMFAGPRYPLTNDSNLEVKVIGVNDIEENVWSTKYGLKGKIDVTGSVRIHDKRANSISDKTIPLELKTGNPNLSSSHAAQVSLYSMMIEDRYAETNQGFVIYLKNKAAMLNVALTHNIKRDLIQRRNQINYHMKSSFLGPDMLDQPRVCKNCERLTECVLMSDIYTPGQIDEYSTMKTLESEAIGHLDEKFKIFFQKYHEKLVALMNNNTDKHSTENNKGDLQSKSSGSFWTYSSEEAENRGTGFGKLQVNFNHEKKDAGFLVFKRHPKHLDSGTDKTNGTSDKHDQHSKSPVLKKQKILDYFKPVQKSPDKTKGKPFNTTLNFTRCRLAVSLDDDNQDMDSQNSSTAIAIGFINEIKTDQIIMKINEGIDTLKTDLIYRVDKLEKRAQVDIERVVLVRLLAREDWRCDRVRQLILDPKYKPVDNVELNLFVLSTSFEMISELDAEQQKFVVQAVSTDNYYILNESIEPNKSKLHKIISVLARVIDSLERTTLIVAKNIDDVMELMRLLQQKKMRFIIIDDGKSTKARYQYASHLVKVVQGVNLDIGKRFDAYIRQHESAPVVITSYAMSIGGLLFTRRTFDYCIAYDCDSTELLMSLSPMFSSDRHIIIDVNDEEKSNNPTVVGDKFSNVILDVSLGDHLRALRSEVSTTATLTKS